MTPHHSLAALFLIKTLNIYPNKNPTKSLPVVVQYGIRVNIELNESLILQQICRPPVVCKASSDRHRGADGQELHRIYMYMYICVRGAGVHEEEGEKAQLEQPRREIETKWEKSTFLFT